MYTTLIGLQPYYVSSSAGVELANISLVYYIVLDNIVEDDIEYVYVVKEEDFKYVCILNKNEIRNHQCVKKYKRKNLYTDKIDASIQMTFVCVKSAVSINEVQRVTNNTITASTYLELYNLFETEFPEKLI